MTNSLIKVGMKGIAVARKGCLLPTIIAPGTRIQILEKTGDAFYICGILVENEPHYDCKTLKENGEEGLTVRLFASEIRYLPQ